jgi:hypothetical protein
MSTRRILDRVVLLASGLFLTAGLVWIVLHSAVAGAIQLALLVAMILWRERSVRAASSPPSHGPTRIKGPSRPTFPRFDWPPIDGRASFHLPPPRQPGASIDRPRANI